MKTINGDLLELAEQGHFDIIIHGCNCSVPMGSGIAKQIREKYPEAHFMDEQTIRGDRNKLGHWTSVEEYMRGNWVTIINAYTQFDTNKKGEWRDRFEYEAFQRILNRLLFEFPKYRFGFPMIGCGLAGGDEARIVGMIEVFAAKIEERGGTVTLVKYAK